MYPLEPDADSMLRLVDEAMRRIVAHIESLPAQPSVNVDGALDYARTLIEPLPQRGESYDKLLDDLFNDYAPRSFNAASPGYLAYIPGGGLFYAAVADLIADSINRYVGVCAAAPALVQLEANVVRWFCEIVGYSRTAGGVLTTGGSLANFTAIVAARKNLLGDDFADATLYCSSEVHHSFQKAADLAGFRAANIREVGVDAQFRMRLDELEAAIAKDSRPFFVVGSAGTTNTGAVDDLEAIARIARERKMWFHVDGAYGAFFMLTERGRAAMRGIELADSITLDPHKTLFQPYGTGAVLVRDASTLRRAFSSHADYLPDMQREEELIDFCEISPELSRDFRGLRVWLPIKLLGIEPFREALDEKLDLIDFVTSELRKIDGIEIVAEPQLTIVAFRLNPWRTGDSSVPTGEGACPPDLNALNRELIERINAKKRVMLTPTVFRGTFLIRICIVSHRTHRDRIEMGLEDIREAVASLS
jgi:aromatic-L-amino-acid/L-tryptophan decarboxylase